MTRERSEDDQSVAMQVDGRWYGVHRSLATRHRMAGKTNLEVIEELLTEGYVPVPVPGGTSLRFGYPEDEV